MRRFRIECQSLSSDAKNEDARNTLIRTARFVDPLRNKSCVLFEIVLAQRTIEKPPHTRQFMTRPRERRTGFRCSVG